jgi:hypothetical protein
MRPEAQLFLHVLSATALFGSALALMVLGLAGGRVAERRPLARGALATTLAVGVPSWAVMLAFGTWTESDEGWPSGLKWLDIGHGVADAGIVVLLALAGLSYAWLRRPSSARLGPAVGLVALGYAVALGVAWWVMTTKVPS